jgi:hypothetical protein
MERIDPKSCASTPIGSHYYDYGKIGFSPCKEYVSHEANKPCNVIETTEIKESSSEPKTCMCQTSICPCGDFVSHKVFEPCNAGEVKKQ